VYRCDSTELKLYWPKQEQWKIKIEVFELMKGDSFLVKLLTFALIITLQFGYNNKQSGNAALK
jgi:hypothetical protein